MVILRHRSIPEAPRFNPLGVAERVRAILGDEEIEHFYLLCYDRRFRLTGERFLAAGDFYGVTMTIREFIWALFENDAFFCVLVHNHPRGQATPSQDDHICMRELDGILEPLQMVMLDFLIVGEEGVFSARSNRYLIQS